MIEKLLKLFKRREIPLICYHIADATEPPYDYFADGRRGWYKPTAKFEHPLVRKYVDKG